MNKLGSDGSIRLHVVAIVHKCYRTSCICDSNGFVLVVMD